MERRQWNLKWTADNAILCLLHAMICIPVACGLGIIIFRVAHGKTMENFPTDLWLIYSGILTAGYSSFVLRLKMNRDKKAEIQEMREAIKTACHERQERRTNAQTEKNEDPAG